MANTMKAVVKTKTAHGAEWLDMPYPTLLEDWVIVKVKATSICGTDVHIYEWNEWSDKRIGGKSLPQTLGHEVAGEVVEVGKNCKRIKVGDSISAETHIYSPEDLTSMLGIFHVGKNMKILGVDTNGAFAEYFAIPEIVCWKNDPSIPPEIASIQEPLGNATYAVLGEDNDVAGKTMLITGDGPISLFATGIARTCGVAKIILTGMSEFNMAIAKKMGADMILDVTKTSPEERLQIIMDNTDGFGVDVALEIAGAQSSIHDCFNALRKGGRLSAFGLPNSPTVNINYSDFIVFKGCQIHGINGRKIFDTWYRNRNLLANNRFDPRPVITHMMPLEDYAKGFDLLTANPRLAAKIVLFPDKDELAKAQKRLI